MEQGAYSGLLLRRPQISVGAVRELPLRVAYHPSGNCCKPLIGALTNNPMPQWAWNLA
jgi:hypothetical protein